MQRYKKFSLIKYKSYVESFTCIKDICIFRKIYLKKIYKFPA